MFCSPPVLRLEDAKGISKDQLSALKTELDRMANELLGEVKTSHFIGSISEM